jgi:hypothetical protein
MHTAPMIFVPGPLFQTAMRRALLGAHAQDPVVPDGRSIPDRPLRIRRLDDRLATLVDARSRRRDVAFPDRADERCAA